MLLRRRLLPLVTGGLMAAGLVACGDDPASVDDTGGTVPDVGDLPALQTGRGPDGRPLVSTAAGVEATTVAMPGARPTSEPVEIPPGSTDPGDSDTTTASSETTAASDVAPDAVIGEHAAGNRILALGDSITAAIGPQYGGQLCALEDAGWFLGVDAFQGRSIDAGVTALRRDIATDDWDAAIVNLGSNYRGDRDEYAAALRQILNAFRSKPVLVVTVTEFEDDIVEVNDAIREVAAARDDVWLVEWAEATADDSSFTGGDGLHLSEAGRLALADLLAAAIGEAPRAGDAEPGCDLLRDAEADATSSGGSDESDGDGDDGGG